MQDLSPLARPLRPCPAEYGALDEQRESIHRATAGRCGSQESAQRQAFRYGVLVSEASLTRWRDLYRAAS